MTGRGDILVVDAGHGSETRRGVGMGTTKDVAGIARLHQFDREKASRRRALL